MRPRNGSGPWLNLFIVASLAVVAVIAALSYAPATLAPRQQIDLTAPQIPAPAAPSAMD